MNDCLSEILNRHKIPNEEDESKCKQIVPNLIESNLISSDKKYSLCLEVYSTKLIEFKQNIANKSLENDLLNKKEECFRLITDKRTKSAQYVFNLLDDCLNEPLAKLETNESKCKSINEIFLNDTLPENDQIYYKCLKNYLDKLIDFKMNQSEMLSKEKELFKVRLECEKQMKSEKSSIKKLINSLNECLDEPNDKLDHIDSKCYNINDTVIKMLNDMDKKEMQTCFQSYVVHVGNTNYGGHFLIWKRKTDTLGWLKISDQPTKSYANLVKNYQNVYLLFLDKFKGF